MALFYGFNFEETVRFFKAAAEIDPKAAPPRWGIALALGPNINDPEPRGDRLERAFESITMAQKLCAGAPEIEVDYLEALSRRCSDDANADHQA